MKAISNNAAALVLALLASAAAAPVINAQIELVNNRGFETGDFTGWSAPSPNPNPWSIVSTNHHSGQFSAMCPDLGYAVAATTLFQPVGPSRVEDIVSAGFWYYIARPSPGGSPAFATLLTFSDGTWVQDSLFTSDPSYRLNQWAFRDWMPTLDAYPGKTLVQVGFFPQYGDTHFVDDVSVIGTLYVREPSTSALLGFCIAAPMIARWRR
jgi:hypothetical protein